MLFSSTIFLFTFLPLTLAGYYLLGKRYRNVFLLIMSLGFYAWGEPRFVLVMLGSIALNYLAALVIDKVRKVAKPVLILAIAVNVGLLYVYKYLGFTSRVVALFGITFTDPGFVLPIGISFFTFQAMSYVIDVYRKPGSAQVKPHNVALYIALFPQLVAGPIVRYGSIAEQLEHRTYSAALFAEGVRRFIVGFAKKVILANNLSLIADAAFNMPDASRGVAYAWLGVLAYALQLLFDFCGYSDMAIGLGKMFGFEFEENFNYPYMAKSVSEFWHRWHISLGQWFRDYIYFPLGGSRVKKPRLVFNLFVVWFLTGFWHGANYNFIVWGLLYFVFVTFEKLAGIPKRLKSPIGRGFYRIIALLVIIGGRVLFRATSGSAALGYSLSMVGLTGNADNAMTLFVTFREHWFFLAAALVCTTPALKILGEKLAVRFSRAYPVARHVCYFAVFLWAISYIVMGAHNPFIYFNF
ncbi:MAG: MBOAT family protein [Oscillospiraceae bacterium]|jgi:D-alanyl-lipoteichoic acid acyltransferase DltB (MBOAT superfamily)|nr:MBOAT family protein [Oscillospiraceae bacterium]